MEQEIRRTTDAVRAAVERLALEAQQLKKLSELQALRENPREIYVDPGDLLSFLAADTNNIQSTPGH